MKATKIKYEKTFNLGNYSNEVIGVEVELGEGENALTAIEAARDYVNKVQRHAKDVEILNAMESNPGRYDVAAYKQAQKNCEDSLLEELPF